MSRDSQSTTQSSAGPIVGIDLGTTNSVVACFDERGPYILDEDAGPLVPSVVRYSSAGDTVEAVGVDARLRAVEFPDRTIASVKRLMGRSARDAASDQPFLSYEIVEGAHETARIRVGERIITPQEVSAEILRELKRKAEAALGTPVQRAVITVPAYFDDAQRQATRDAGRLAGLEVVRIVNEPTAAALAYGIGAGASAPQTIAVFDLGGGTFDISILAITPAEEDDNSPAGADFFQVLSTAGDTHLGGDDVDHMLFRLLATEISQQFDISLDRDVLDLTASIRQAIREFSESIKITLSAEESAHVRIDLGAGRFFERTITRDELDALLAPWIDQALVSCRRALRDSKLEASDIDRVIMVGGSTRIPLVRRRVGEFFSVAPYTALDPDLVVALGAAAQASILSGDDRSRLLMDVIPLSLGIETAGGAVAKIIVRNQSAPARAAETFSTSVDNQTSIKLHILQGEREMVEDCRSLAVFHLAGLPPMPAGIPQLEVEFLVDANGVLSVSAVEKRSGKRASLQVVPAHGLTRDEVERMETESLTHAREDMTRHRIVDLIANTQLDVKWIRAQLDRLSADLDPDYRADLEKRIAYLDDIITRAQSDWRSVDPEDFHSAKQALDEASVRMHEISIAKSLREDENHPA